MNLMYARCILVSLGVLMTFGCASHPFPESSLTGVVSDVKISDESLSPEVVTVKQGDEIRWINSTKGIVDISFMQSLSGIISCEKGFEPTGGSLFGASGGEVFFVARVDGNHHASLCFSLPGTYEYAVQLDEATTGKSTRMHGTIAIQ